MQLIQTTHFERDYKRLPPTIQKRTDEKLKLLVQNVSHPSLRVKRIVLSSVSSARKEE
ncbi:MAG: hypothetical protein V3U04_00295 [Candidatus Aerophobetes bacterium]